MHFLLRLKLRPDGMTQIVEDPQVPVHARQLELSRNDHLGPQHGRIVVVTRAARSNHQKRIVGRPRTAFVTLTSGKYVTSHLKTVSLRLCALNQAKQRHSACPAAENRHGTM